MGHWQHKPKISLKAYTFKYMSCAYVYTYHTHNAHIYTHNNFSSIKLVQFYIVIYLCN